MSTLLADTIRKTGGTAGVDIRVKNTSVYESEGGTSVTLNLVQGLIKGWAAVDGATDPSILDSHNVASITDNGTGDYTANFTSAITDANYAVTTGFTPYTTTNFTTYGAIHGDATTGATAKTTSAIRLVYKNLANDSNFYDTIEVNAVIHR